MKRLAAKPELEKSIQKKIVDELRHLGWFCKKTHGSRFSAGFPDLYCIPPCGTAQWIEVKRPKVGKTTSAQKKVFDMFEQFGVGVWILTGPGQTRLLNEKPNWRTWNVRPTC